MGTGTVPGVWDMLHRYLLLIYVPAGQERRELHTSSLPFTTTPDRSRGSPTPPLLCPRKAWTGCGKKAVPAPHPSPRQLPSSLLGSQLRQWLPWGERHLYAFPALGPLRGGFLVLLPWGTCLILGLPEVVLSHLRGLGLVTGELQGDEAPESGLKIVMCD